MVAFLALALAMPLVLSGCERHREPEIFRKLELKQEEQLREREEAQAEPDQVLPAGKILGVRIHYGDSGAASCRVRIDNERNDWYDYVEWIAHDGTLSGWGGLGYDDYEFGAENFNRQITNPHDNPKYQRDFVDGLYQITVTCDSGYASSVTARWNYGRFTPNLFSFSAG